MVCAAIARTDGKLSISATTRPEGRGEVDGRDYYFLTQEQFLDKIQKGEFLEYAKVFDNYYGTEARAVMELLEAGHAVVLEIDVQGAGQVFERFPQACGVLIVAPDGDEIERRIRDRGRDEPESIKKRLAKAEAEIAEARNSGNFKNTIVNDNLEEAIDAMVALIEGA